MPMKNLKLHLFTAAMFILAYVCSAQSYVYELEYKSAYALASERFFEYDNKVLIEAITNKYEVERNLDEFVLKITEFLKKPDINPYEISRSNQIKSQVLRLHPEDSVEKRKANNTKALAALEEGISGRGFLKKEISNVKLEINQLRTAIGLPKKHFVRKPDAKRIKVVAPKAPNTFRGQGFCTVIFDLENSGKPINIEVPFCTDKALKKPNLKAVKKWRYEQINDEGALTNRTKISTRLTYRS